jgi:hypothetical protein
MPSPPRRDVLFPNGYAWFVLVSALDVMLTWIVLWFGGREANSLASVVLRRYGLVGMVSFKFALVVLVVVLCEWIGRYNDRVARRMAGFAVVVTCLPVVLAIALLLAHGR